VRRGRQEAHKREALCACAQGTQAPYGLGVSIWCVCAIEEGCG